jgi:hypothetical protein
MNYTKTQKGKDALSLRSAALPTRLRGLLVLIDGRQPDATLQSLAKQSGVPEEALAELEKLGFISRTPVEASEPTLHLGHDFDDDRTVRVAANPIDRVVQAKKFMQESLVQAGVPDSGIAQALESAQTMGELKALSEGFKAIMETRRTEEAQALMARLRALLV